MGEVTAKTAWELGPSRSALDTGFSTGFLSYLFWKNFFADLQTTLKCPCLLQKWHNALAAGHLGGLAVLPHRLEAPCRVVASDVLRRVLLVPLECGERLAGGRTASVEAVTGLYTRGLMWNVADSSACAACLVGPGNGHSNLEPVFEMGKVSVPIGQLAVPWL